MTRELSNQARRRIGGSLGAGELGAVVHDLGEVLDSLDHRRYGINDDTYRREIRMAVAAVLDVEAWPTE